MFSGTELGLSTLVHCWLKKSLNKFAFSLKSVISLLFSNNGGIAGIFVLFANVLKIDQYVLVAVRGSLSLIAKRS